MPGELSNSYVLCLSPVICFLFCRVQLNEEQLELWHEEEVDVSDRIPHDGVTSKSCVKDFSKQGDEVVSKSSGGQEGRNKRNGGKETPQRGERCEESLEGDQGEGKVSHA